MKKTVFVLVILVAASITFTSFLNDSAAPRLYPGIEAFFKTLKGKEFDTAHHNALENIRYNISLTGLDVFDWNLIFYCSENTFRSQASQVFAQTLCYAKKHKKVKVFSAGLSAGDVNPKLIAYLSKIGYKVSKSEKDGINFYEVKFSDQADPVILFSKTVSDKSLPTKDLTSIVVCDVVKETECASLKFESTPLNMPFEKVHDGDANEKIEATIKGIAAAMLYVTKK